MFNRPKAYDAKKIPRCVTTHYGDPLTFPSFLSRSFPVTSSTPSLMASKLRPAMSLCRNSFRSIVVFAKKGLSVRYWLNAGELAELKRYSVEQAERWGNFTPKDPDALLIAKELTAAYRNNAESERDAADLHIALVRDPWAHSRHPSLLGLGDGEVGKRGWPSPVRAASAHAEGSAGAFGGRAPPQL